MAGWALGSRHNLLPGRQLGCSSVYWIAPRKGRLLPMEINSPTDKDLFAREEEEKEKEKYRRERRRRVGVMPSLPPG